MISQCPKFNRKPVLKNDSKSNIVCTAKRCDPGTKNKSEIAQKYATPIKSSMTRVMSLKDYEYFRSQAMDKASSELEAQLEEAENEKKRLMKESSKRKEKLRMIDMTKPKDVIQNETLAENQKKTSHILERAEMLQLEQEEEIKQCNKIILATKCRIIRDAQITEKKVLNKQLEAEEQRLNQMMENQRRWQIKEEEEKMKEKILQQQYFIQTLKNQIAENEEMRLVEFERKQEESRAINMSTIAWQESELAKMQGRQAENLRIQKELAEVNAQLKHFKEMEKEESRIMDMRIEKFQRKKEEREQKLLEEKKKLEARRSLEKARLAEEAVQSRNFQEKADEINAARIQEEVEREWRRKEREEALKRIEKRKTLMQGREEQLKNKRLLQAIEIERDKREYKRVLELQKVALLQEQEKLKKKQIEAEKHKHEILKQVNAKERERIDARKQLFEEGKAIQIKDELRKNKLDAAIERKCEEMRKAKVPDIYIDEVKRIIKKA